MVAGVCTWAPWSPLAVSSGHLLLDRGGSPARKNLLLTPAGRQLSVLGSFWIPSGPELS